MTRAAGITSLAVVSASFVLSCGGSFPPEASRGGTGECTSAAGGMVDCECMDGTRCSGVPFSAMVLRADRSAGILTVLAGGHAAPLTITQNAATSYPTISGSLSGEAKDACREASVAWNSLSPERRQAGLSEPCYPTDPCRTAVLEVQSMMEARGCLAEITLDESLQNVATFTPSPGR
jgi:hypothetical protein